MRSKILLLTLMASMLVAGCELQANVILDLEADGSGTVGVQLALDEEFKELIDASGEDPTEALLDDGGLFAAIPGSSTRTYTEGDFTFYEATAAFDNVNTFGALVPDDAGNPLSELEIRVDDEVALVRGTLDLEQVTDDADLEDLGGINPSALSEFFGFHIQIKLPGDVKSHNADRELSDGTLEWDIPIFGGDSVLSIEAESDPTGGGDGFPAWLIFVIAAVVALVVFGLYMARRSEKASQPVAVAGGTAHGPDALAGLTGEPTVDDTAGDTAEGDVE